MDLSPLGFHHVPSMRAGGGGHGQTSGARDDWEATELEIAVSTGSLYKDIYIHL